jgi:hypothetical protein
MKNDLKKGGNRPKKGLVSKLRNQSRNIPITRVARLVLQTKYEGTPHFPVTASSAKIGS